MCKVYEPSILEGVWFSSGINLLLGCRTEKKKKRYFGFGILVN